MIEGLFGMVIPFFGQYGYLIIFLSSIFEGLPLVGTMVPGATIAVFAGFLGRTDVLNTYWVIILLALGAFIGDLINYLIGRAYGYPLLKKHGKYILLTEARLENVRERVRQHTGKTLIIGRFTSVTRSVAPFAAGASHINFIPFVFYTLISTLLWAISHAMVGFIFGKWLERISRYLGLIFFLAVLLGVGLVYLYQYINRRHHVFKKLHVYTLVAMIFSLFFFSLTLQDVLMSRWFSVFDQGLSSFLISIRTPWLTTVMLTVTQLADSTFMLPLTLILVLYLIYAKRLYMASLTLFALSFGYGTAFLFKWLTKIVRPENALVETFSSSFPSAHATVAMIFGTFIFLSFLDQIKTRAWKLGFFGIVFLGVMLVGLSRIYLNAHWTTDVVAGMSLGLFSVIFSILLFRIVLFIKRWLY
jgi:membrane protein DedA with SNARE-associated domain/membrane-associated phospholipid phosphatase